jgi:hypothetical protein
MTTRRVKPVITVSSAFEEFTVKTAEALLAQNDSNRSIREAKVEQYARDMRNGNWNLCTGPIVVDVDGKLIDGQHRLTAQIRAGIKIKWLVLRNVDSDVQRTIDTGAMRSAADVLHFAGEQYSQQLATAARLVHRIKTNTMTGRGGYSVSNEEILQVVESEPMLRHSVQISATSNRGGRMTPISPSVMADLLRHPGIHPVPGTRGLPGPGTQPSCQRAVPAEHPGQDSGLAGPCHQGLELRR